uniref:MAM domain-containing protein n=1 Tax=Caenorhabditis japonica TaxID=281687 RepID=A0A8R1DNE8_CAEJA
MRNSLSDWSEFAALHIEYRPFFLNLPLRYLVVLKFIKHFKCPCINISSASAKSPLDCDFTHDCCWATTREEEQWEIRSGDELDLNEFRKIFLTGKTRPPPTGNYAIRVENKKKSSLISCAICTATGETTVKFRHWQSANSMLKICWQLEGDGSPTQENCQLARHSKQSKLNSYKFRDIDKNKNFRLVFIVENADAEMDAESEATIIVDRISVEYESCEHAATHAIDGNVTKKRTRHSTAKVKARSSVTLEKLAQKDSKIREILKTQDDKQAYLKNVDQQIARVVDEVNAKQASLASTPPKVTVPASPKPPAPADPLTDLLGKQFVDFLDPNYESEDDEEDEKDFDEGKVVSTTIPTPTITTVAPTRKPVKRVETSKKSIDTNGQPLPSKNLQPVEHLPIRPIVSESVLKYLTKGKPMPVQQQNGVFSLPSQHNHQIPLGIPSTCSTAGGCLFEKDFCGWTTPDGVTNKFHLKKIHMSSFAEAIVPTGEIAVMETDTKMTQAHTVIFDALEFSMGTRLIACCLADGKLTCPFATPSEHSGILWQFSKFECPINTSKIAFICENFGLSESLCAVDNIRLHTSTDVFFLEACQKDKLHRS